MTATILQFRRPAPKPDPHPGAFVLVRAEENGKPVEPPEVIFQSDWLGCLTEFANRAIRHHVTGTLYRIMPAREGRQ